MQLTDQQEAILKAVRQPSNLFIEARAGSGKTTTLTLIAAELPSPGLALAFNIAAARELRNRLPHGWKASTLNSIGMQVFFRNGMRPEVREDKLLILAEKLQIPPSARYDTIQTVRWARILGIVPKVSGVPRVSGLLPDTPESWKLAAARAEAPDADLDLARTLLAKSIRAIYSGMIDYDDQIYFPTLFLGRWPSYHYILVDEAQDLSPLNLRQLSRLVHQGTRVIAVGDRHQAIYQWRGADDDAVDKTISTFRMRRLPLSVTFRCPKLVVERWKPIIHDFEAAPSNPEGAVQLVRELPPLGPSDAVLAYRNADLISIATDLLDRGLPFQFLGRDFDKAVARLHDRAKGDLDAARRMTRARVKKLRMIGGDPSPVQETYEIYELLHQKYGPEQVIPILNAIISQRTGPTFGTVWRAKGLEWPVVHLVHDVEENHQNVHYVGETRTASVLNVMPIRRKGVDRTITM